MAADDEPVRLILPAGTRYLRVARLVASSLATMAGADLDGVEDLRIAVDELCSSLVEAGGGGTIDVAFRIDDDAVLAEGRTAIGPGLDADPTRRALAEQILGVVCDEHELGTTDDVVWFRLRKRVGEQVRGAAGS